jgi:hypothetical protein
MDQSDLLRKVLDAFEAAGIEHLLVGSLASAVYGEPRLTLDIDVVAALTTEKLPRFFACFPAPEFYVSPEAAGEATRKEKQFNIIHSASGWKVDIIAKKADEFDRSRFARKRIIPVFPDLSVSVASPEDIIIKKMEYYREGGSEKHLRDISGILRVSGEGLEYSYIESWASRKGLTEIWRAVLKRTGE